MNYVRIYDKRKKSIARLLIGSDNILKKDFLTGCFPGATAIFFLDEELHEDIQYVIEREKNNLKYLNRDALYYFSVPRDDNGNFVFNWDPNIVYNLVYYNGKKCNFQ